MRILVLEDMDLAARGLQRMLERAGHEVVLAATAAVAMARLNEAPFDIVIADYGLGEETTGLDVLRFCRDHLPSAARILISGAVDPAYIIGGDWFLFLAKPFRREALLAVIESHTKKEH